MAEIDLEAADEGGGRECVHPVLRGGSFGHTGAGAALSVQRACLK